MPFFQGHHGLGSRVPIAQYGNSNDSMICENNDSVSVFSSLFFEMHMIVHADGTMWIHTCFVWILKYARKNMQEIKKN